jgi:hypothetical protein
MTVLLKVAHDGAESQIFEDRSCLKSLPSQAFGVAAKADADGFVMCLAVVAPWRKFGGPFPSLPSSACGEGREGNATGG